MFKKIALVALALVAASSAFAAPKQYQLSPVLMDAKLGIYSRVSAAYVTLDLQYRTARLELIPWMAPCPAGTMCRMNMPAPMIVELPIVSKKTDSACGEITYVAKEDKRPVDGNFNQITVTDYSKSHCMYFKANYLTVELVTISGGRGGAGLMTRSVLEEKH